jgi:TatA/E family protein of Tat protein translocase
MFGMGMPEIILILAIALIVLGPKKLPEIAKSLGRGIAEFKKATQDFKQNIEVDNDFKEAKDTLKEIKGDLEQGVRESVADTPPGTGLGSKDQERPQQPGAGDTPDADSSAPPKTDEEAASAPTNPAAAEASSPEGTTQEKGSVKDA